MWFMLVIQLYTLNSLLCLSLTSELDDAVDVCCQYSHDQQEKDISFAEQITFRFLTNEGVKLQDIFTP